MVYADARLPRAGSLVAPCTWGGGGRAEVAGSLMDVSGAADPMGLGPVQAGFLPREAGDGRSRVEGQGESKGGDTDQGPSHWLKVLKLKLKLSKV